MQPHTHTLPTTAQKLQQEAWAAFTVMVPRPPLPTDGASAAQESSPSCRFATATPLAQTSSSSVGEGLLLSGGGLIYPTN